MSQTSRSHVRALTRWREQVARWIISAGHGAAPELPDFRGSHLWPVAYASILEGAHRFDVAAARAAAERELARAEADLAELSVFKDWTRTKGRGPENREPGAHGRTIGVWSVLVAPAMGGEIWLTVDGEECQPVHVDGGKTTTEVEACLAKTCGGTSTPALGVTVLAHRVDAHGWVPASVTRQGEEPVPGGWPGNLAREYARKRCPNRCTPSEALKVETTHRASAANGIETRFVVKERRRIRLANGVECTTCDRGWVQHGSRRAEIVTAPARARVARRVLVALDGQPSECRACTGYGVDVEKVRALPSREVSVLAGRLDDFGAPGNALHDLETLEASAGFICPDCRGTGHNLRGVLPPVERTSQLRRRGADSVRHSAGPRMVDGQPMIPWWSEFARREDWGSWHEPTRVVARGRHRPHPSTLYCAPAFLVTLAPEDLPDVDTRINSRPHPEHERLDFDRLPAWRRGELRHAERRRTANEWPERWHVRNVGEGPDWTAGGWRVPRPERVESANE